MADAPGHKAALAAVLEKQPDPNALEAHAVALHQRNTNFDASWLPFRNEPNVHLVEGSTTGAWGLFNPTHANFTQTPNLIAWDEFDATDESALPASAQYEWSTRDIRKGRHKLLVERNEENSKKFDIPPATATLKGLLNGICAMFTTFPISNISWQTAIVFTLGSVIWVLSSFFAFMPMDKKAPPSFSAYGCGISAFVGSCVFVFGSVLLFLESVKDCRETAFGWTTNQQWDEETSNSIYRVMPGNKSGQGQQKRELESWTQTIALPNWQEVKTHYIHEVAFWTAVIQLASSLIFLISGITALPRIYDHLSKPLQDGVYWTPKVIACVGFIASAILSMIECQKKWYRPAWNSLGWHIGLWKCLGSIGFILVPCYGFNPANWAQYQATVHCLWGSWAFLICSVLLWYESVTQYTVQDHIKKDNKENKKDQRRDTVWGDEP